MSIQVWTGLNKIHPQYFAVTGLVVIGLMSGPPCCIEPKKSSYIIWTGFGQRGAGF